MRAIELGIRLLFFLTFFHFSCQPWNLEKLDISCPKIINLSGNLNFGSVVVGTTPIPINLRIYNSGTCPLTIFSINLPVGFSHNFVGQTLIQPNQFLNLIIAFNPTQSGTFNGAATINSDATEGVESIIISGLATDPITGGSGILSVSGDLDFGTVEKNSTIFKTLTLSNIGGATLTIHNIQSNISAFTISGVTNNFIIDKNESKQITIQMNTSMVGTHQGKISINSSVSLDTINVFGEVTDTPPKIDYIELKGFSNDSTLLNGYSDILGYPDVYAQIFYRIDPQHPWIPEARTIQYKEFQLLPANLAPDSSYNEITNLDKEHILCIFDWDSPSYSDTLDCGTFIPLSYQNQDVEFKYGNNTNIILHIFW